MQADQQVALMLPELFITNTSCLFSLVVLAAILFFFFFNLLLIAIVLY